MLSVLLKPISDCFCIECLSVVARVRFQVVQKIIDLYKHSSLLFLEMFLGLGSNPDLSIFIYLTLPLSPSVTHEEASSELTIEALLKGKARCN
jgi:hypothetical protein